MLRIFSRYIVGVVVHARETGPLAEEMMREVFGIHGIPQVVHADRGTSMTSKSVAILLEDLKVTRSHSRPRVSNDNPYSDYAEFGITASRFLRRQNIRRPTPNGSCRCKTPGRGWTPSFLGITTNITTQGSDSTRLLPCTMATLLRSRLTVQPPWPPREQRTRQDSPPTTTQRSSTCPRQPGLTNQPRTTRPKRT